MTGAGIEPAACRIKVSPYHAGRESPPGRKSGRNPTSPNECRGVRLEPGILSHTSSHPRRDRFFVVGVESENGVPSITSCREPIRVRVPQFVSQLGRLGLSYDRNGSDWRRRASRVEDVRSRTPAASFVEPWIAQQRIEVRIDLEPPRRKPVRALSGEAMHPSQWRAGLRRHLALRSQRGWCR
jgi:hypothetical protein